MNKKDIVITIVGLIIVWIVPLLVWLFINDAMSAYWLGVALTLAWREWVQKEIDNRRRKSDRANRELLQARMSASVKQVSIEMGRRFLPSVETE